MVNCITARILIHFVLFVFFVLFTSDNVGYD